MKEIDQQIALCEWAGWRIIMHEDGWRSPICPTTGNHIGFWSTEAEAKRHYPDTNSLDVLHEMEKRLTYDEQHHYGEALRIASKNIGPKGGQHPLNGFGCFALATVTAAQRREALLKTLNLWREDSK